MPIILPLVWAGIGLAGSVILRAGSRGGLGTQIDRAGNVVLPVGLPDIGQTADLFASGLIDSTQLRSLYLLNGVNIQTIEDRPLNIWFIDHEKLESNETFIRQNPHPWKQELRQHSWIPTIDQTLMMLNREFISENAANRFLLFNRVSQKQVRDTILKTRFEIPGPSDLIRFAVRESFTPSIIEKFGYHHELPSAILPWMKRQGYGGGLGFQRPPGSTDDLANPLTGEVKWFDMYWYAHWDLPSLTQGYMMLHRLYDSSLYGASPDVLTPDGIIRSDTVFNIRDLELLQKAQDLPDYWRRRLSTISYSPLTRVDVRRIHEMTVNDARDQHARGEITDEELQTVIRDTDGVVYHSYRAIGYDDRNAKLLLDFTRRLTAKAYLGRTKTETPASVCEHYSLGSINREQALRLLRRAGIREGQIEAYLQSCELKIRTAFIREELRTLKRAFITGQYTLDQMRTALIGIGMTLNRVTTYIASWDLVRRYRAKEITLHKLSDWLENGVIGEPEMILRMQNLGYNPVDITRVLTRVRQRIIRRIATEAQRSAREAEQTRRRAAQEARRLQREQERIERSRILQLLSASSETHLKDWYDDELITRDEIAARFRLKNWPEADISRWLESYTPARP